MPRSLRKRVDKIEQTFGLSAEREEQDRQIGNLLKLSCMQLKILLAHSKHLEARMRLIAAGKEPGEDSVPTVMDQLRKYDKGLAWDYENGRYRELLPDELDKPHDRGKEKFNADEAARLLRENGENDDSLRGAIE